MPRRDPLVMATAGALASAAALHVAWGLRVQIPGVDSAAMAEAVGGAGEPPGPVACFTVAGLLGGAAASVAGVRWLPAPLARVGRVGVVLGLGGRAALGLTGHTDLVAPGRITDRFRRWDRWLYTPLCLALAAGAARAMRVHRP
jgi:Protein of unknown function (DUF3995)